MAKHKSVFSLKNIILLFVIVILAGVVIAQLIIKKGDVVPKRVGLAPGEENWVDACSFLSQPVKDEVYRLEHLLHNGSEFNITFVENQWMNRNDYFLARYGEQLYQVKSIINQTFGFGDDRIIFKGAFSGNTYETTILSEGRGVVVLGSQSCDVEYRGASSSSEDSREVRLNCPPLESVDTFFCDFSGDFCADSDGGVFESFGKTINATFSFEDVCIDDKTVLEGYCDFGAVRTRTLDCALACVGGSCAGLLGICNLLNVSVMERFKLLNISSRVSFFENKWMSRGTYFISRFGENIFKVETIRNETNGFTNDRVAFLGEFSGNSYESTITSEGTGTASFGGWLCTINYRGAEVRVNCPPLQDIDIANCNMCADSDRGFNFTVKGTAINLTSRGTDSCVYNSTTRSYNLLKEYYCDGGISTLGKVKYQLTLCPNATTCFDGACGGGGSVLGNVTTKFPDLVPKQLSVVGIGVFNTTACTVVATTNITNIGNAPAGSSKTEFIMFPTLPAVLFNTSPLNPSAYALHSIDYRLTLGRPYVFKVMADKTLVVKENNEVNNPRQLGFNVTSCNFFKDITF